MPIGTNMYLSTLPVRVEPGFRPAAAVWMSTSWCQSAWPAWFRRRCIALGTFSRPLPHRRPPPPAPKPPRFSTERLGTGIMPAPCAPSRWIVGTDSQGELPWLVLFGVSSRCGGVERPLCLTCQSFSRVARCGLQSRCVRPHSPGKRHPPKPSPQVSVGLWALCSALELFSYSRISVGMRSAHIEPSYPVSLGASRSYLEV